jgi:hypothetical protein
MRNINRVLLNVFNVKVAIQGIGTMKFILAFISLCDKVCVFDGRISYIAVAVTMVK